MDYLYDIFISYRRHRDWTPWTRNHICNLLDSYLSDELCRTPNIFIDEQITPGADWPNRLAEALARSRILVPIFSGSYFASEWCLHELDLMYDRSIQAPSAQLIIPIIVHDGELIPQEINRIQPIDLKKFRNTDIQRGTELYQQLSEEIKNSTPSIAAAIHSAPSFNPVWQELSRSRFDKVYVADCEQKIISLSGLTRKNPLELSSPPRI